MHDLSIMALRYFGAAFIIWGLAGAIVFAIQPISVLANKGLFSARARRGARRCLATVFFVAFVVVTIGAIMMGASFDA